MMDIPVIISNKHIITQLSFYIQNYLSKMIKKCNYFNKYIANLFYDLYNHLQ